MKKDRILYTKPSITDKEVSYATDAARNGWGSNCYAYIEKFESLFSKHIGTKYAVATSSCTGAIHMGLAALGIGPGDEVIIADTNWIASAAPITYLGATPIFVDILPDSWCIDPQKAEAAITPRTKAIIAVHIYGNICDMDALNALGEKYNVSIVEDSAEAIGSKWKEESAGSIGTFGTFSFHGTKTVTTGEGGMLVTNSDALFNKINTLNNHGRAAGQKKQFWPDMIGFKYKISNIQAAIGCAQLERIDELTERKRAIFKYYHSKLGNLPNITMNPEPPNTTNGYWMPTVVFSKETGVLREKIIETFANENIDARVFFWPLSSLPMFSPKTDNINSYDICQRAINLPSYHEITNDQLDRVIAVIEELHG